MSEFHIGPYKVVGKLGSGAHSIIHHITRSADGKPYALKEVPITKPEDQKFLRQAQHEFQIAQKLDHPNLIKIHALEFEKDWLFRVKKVFLLIEYVNGRTLDTFKSIPLPQQVQIFVCVGSALVHLHRHNICHADLKPNNILLGRGGKVKIIDYGLARLKSEAQDRVQGTPEYMAPEQVKHGFVNEKTDIYNFGATMYRMVTGQLPPPTLVQSSGLPVNEKLWMSLYKPVQEVNAFAPPELCDLIQRCLAFNPANRPERVSEIQGALDHLAEKLAQSPEELLESFEW